ncbi:hypothetical protein ABBQ38_013583 [Trebouxia sp. C0009 RCD-2024]
MQDKQELEVGSRAPVSKLEVSQAFPQSTETEKLRDPPQITAYIKQRQNAALIIAPGSPQAALTGFCDSMDALLTAAAPRMNHIYSTAVITASMHTWGAVRGKLTEPTSLRERLKTLHERCVRHLQSQLAHMSAREISSVLLASAGLGWSPDAVVPGMVQALTVRLLQPHEVGQEIQRPTARDYADLLSALSALENPARPAATSEMVDSIALHFAHLTQHPDIGQHPGARSCANFLQAFAKLKHTAATAELVDSVSLCFARLVASANAKHRPLAQDVAGVLWTLGTMKHTPDRRLLGGFCAYMQTLYRSRDEEACPSARDTANMFWGLAQLGHAPSHGVVSAMLHHLVALCQTQELQPRAQYISMCFLACAELCLAMHPAELRILFRHLLGLHVSKVDIQQYSNVAWSLAVMGRLQISMFEALLQQLATKHKLLLGQHGMSARPALKEARQLHQALEWLKPAQGSDRMKAWLNLCSKLQAVAPKVQAQAFSPPGQAEMLAALAKQNLLYKLQVPFGVYQADAVLYPHHSNGAEVLLMLERPNEYIINLPKRVRGRAAFRRKMLGRYGTVVTIPYKQGHSSVESMAGVPFAVLSQLVPAAMQLLPHHLGRRVLHVAGAGPRLWVWSPPGCPANLAECHPCFRNKALLQWCKARHIHVTAYSPLGSPDCAFTFRGKAPLLMQDPTVTAIADRLSCSPAQVLIRWSFQHRTSVLPKSTSAERIKEAFNFAAVCTHNNTCLSVM